MLCRPMRPKPLMPTRMVIGERTSSCCESCAALRFVRRGAVAAPIPDVLLLVFLAAPCVLPWAVHPGLYHAPLCARLGAPRTLPGIVAPGIMRQPTVARRLASPSAMRLSSLPSDLWCAGGTLDAHFSRWLWGGSSCPPPSRGRHRKETRGT